MTPAQLKHQCELRGSKFFNRDNMKFFGDTMSNFGVRDGGDTWDLYRKKPVKHGIQSTAHFDKKTFEKVHISNLLTA